MTTVEILDHLRRQGYTVQARRSGGRAQCPGHHDRRPSLDVTTGDDGRVLIYCRAGCRTEDVLTAAGLKLGDLFEKSQDAIPRLPRAVPKSTMERARAAAKALGMRQPWTRHLERYAAADLIRHADRIRSQYTEVMAAVTASVSHTPSSSVTSVYCDLILSA